MLPTWSPAVFENGTDPAKIAERDQYANKELYPAELQALVKKAAAEGFDLISMLRDLDAHVARQEQEAKDAARELAALQRRLRKAAALKSKTAPFIVTEFA
jgi:hypothetical protein